MQMARLSVYNESSVKKNRKAWLNKKERGMFVFFRFLLAYRDLKNQKNLASFAGKKKPQAQREP